MPTVFLPAYSRLRGWLGVMRFIAGCSPEINPEYENKTEPPLHPLSRVLRGFGSSRRQLLGPAGDHLPLDLPLAPGWHMGNRQLDHYRNWPSHSSCLG